jgi:hypothetical protein
MQLEYLSDHNRQTAPVLLVYGDEPDDAVVLRGAADELAVGEICTRCASTVSPLPRHRGRSLVASVGADDRGVEPISEPRRTFRCVLRPDRG